MQGRSQRHWRRQRGQGGRSSPPGFSYMAFSAFFAIFQYFFAIFWSFFRCPPSLEEDNSVFAIFRSSFFRCPPLENFLPTPLAGEGKISGPQLCCHGWTLKCNENYKHNTSKDAQLSQLTAIEPSPLRKHIKKKILQFITVFTNPCL